MSTTSPGQGPNTAPQIQAPGWSKPFAAAWRARGYFAIAFVFWILSNTVPVPFSSAQPPTWWETLLAKGVGSFDKISFAAFLAGLIYAVMSDAFDYVWSNNLEKEVRRSVAATTDVIKNGLADFTSGLVGMSFEAVKVWIDGQRGSPTQLREIGVSSLKYYFGPHHAENDNGLIDFIVADVLEASAFSQSQTIDNYVSGTVIRPCKLDGHFEWEERKNYEIICPEGAGTFPLTFESSVKIGKDHLKEILEIWDFRITFDRVSLFDFRKWWASQSIKSFDPPFRAEGSNAFVNYDGAWMVFGFSKECTILQERTPVSIFERSFLSQDDRCYAVTTRHPTHGMQVSLSIEGLANWVVKPPVVSAKAYKQGQRVVTVDNDSSQTGSAVVRGWTCPGVALVIEWGPA